MTDSTYWVRQLQEGNRQAAQELWQRYCERLIAVARKYLKGRNLGAADEDDIALSAFASFYRAAEQGRFPQLEDSLDLWRLLIVFTRRKVSHRLRHENCLKRRPPDGAGLDEMTELDDFVSKEPTPEFGAAAVDSFRLLISKLDDTTLRSVALMKMEGYTNGEIASRLDCSLSTVERKLRRIRREWAAIADPVQE